MPGLLLEDLLHPTNVSPNLNQGRTDSSAEDADMASRHPSNTPSGGSGKQSGRARRARSASQPATPPAVGAGAVGAGGQQEQQPSAGPSTPRLSEIDFGLMQHPFGGGREGSGGMFPVPTGYDEDAIGRALRAMQQDAPAPPQAHSNPPPAMGPAPVSLMPPGASGGPQVTEMFLAALPWLQYLQIQQQQHAGAGQVPHPSQELMPPMQGHGHGHGHGHGQQQHTPQHPLHPHLQQQLAAYQQQQQQRALPPSQFGVMPLRRPSSQPQQQGGFPFMPPPHQQGPSFSAGHFGTLPPLGASGSPMEGIMPLPPMQRSSSAGNTSSPEPRRG
uniref:Glucose repression mediator protein CYC8 n=1 Tax=Ganoderma boninense TaxID=34458 RepID=A0A5K1K8B6_9APHY|nr:Glucose repression mediator protein CYC8 [Ganoderma boninense]